MGADMGSSYMPMTKAEAAILPPTFAFMEYDKIEGKKVYIQFRPALPPKNSKWALHV